MSNIFKSTVYRIFCGKEFLFSLLLLMVLGLAFSSASLPQGSATEVLSGLMDNISFFTIIGILFFIVLIIGGDFKNKTLFYEIMSGHKRTEVFIGRLLCCSLFSMIIALISLFCAVLPVLVFKGGDFITGDINYIFVRILLICFVYLFYIILITSVAFITKSLIGGFALSWMLIIIVNGTAILDYFNVTIFGESISSYFSLFAFRAIATQPLELNRVLMMFFSYFIGIIIFLSIGIISFRRSELK